MTVAEWDKTALVPVIVIVKLPLAEAVQDRLEVPEPPTLGGDREHAIPLDGILVVVRLTTPANPLIAVIVIVDVPAWLTLTLTLVGPAAMAKSRTSYVRVAECDRVPLVPVTMMV